MQGTMIVIPPAGEIVEQPLDEPPGLRVLQTHIGGSIEHVPFFDHFVTRDGSIRRCVIYCNEEGKLVGLPLNPRATDMWADSRDQLVGTIVILYGDDAFMEAL